MVLAVILAVLVGASLGLLGGGGSILTVPILRYVLGLEAHAAIAMSLLLVGMTSATALITHARRGRVQWRTGFAFGAAGMLGAYAAGRVAHFIPEGFLLSGFGLMMLATAIAMLRPERKSSSARAHAPAPLLGKCAPPDRARRARLLPDERGLLNGSLPAPVVRASRLRPLPLRKMLIEGLLVGAATGLVGAGGGFLVVPALVLLGRLPMDVAIATSLLVISLKSFAGFAGFLGHTELDWGLVTAIGSASVVGSFAGAALASRISTRVLREAFGWFVVAMAVFILAQEVPLLFGYPARPGVALALALLASGAVFALRLRFQRRARRPSREGRSSPPAVRQKEPHLPASLWTTEGK